jgi:hypothetical protein
MSAPTLSSTYEHYLAAVDAKEDAASVYAALLDLPPTPVVQVLKGSTLTLMGRDAWMPWTKMKYADDGIILLERTLQALTLDDQQTEFQGVPVDVFVIFIAGTTYTRLPDMFHKKAEGQALLRRIAHHSALHHLTQQGVVD